MTFKAKLDRAIDRTDSLLCIGLDPDRTKLPPHTGQFEFNRRIIDATADLASVYKPNPAFYEALGLPGIQALKDTCDYLRQHHPDTPIIIDSKRADIGNTNQGYTEYIFDYLGADAVTVPPYMGGESLAPFLDRADKGIIVLCRTSNPGAGEFQDLRVDGKPLYRAVARAAAGPWNKHGNIALVVGATYPRELGAIRELVGPEIPILVPGVGAQGGSVADLVPAGLGARGRGIMVNASRGVIFADDPRRAAQQIRDEINKYREEV
jgi:orotidine-5'-phosphate decarboxylase